jgi:D-serine dehydratase
MAQIARHPKSYPLSATPGDLADIAQRRWHLLNDDLAYPIAVLRRSALMHNLRWMQGFADRKGVQFAPHGKTTMSPELFALQLAAGAWGLTFATVFQLSVGVAAGVRRALIANQVLGAADLAGLQHLLRQTPGLRVWFLVDSLAQLRLIEQWALAQDQFEPFDVLLEMGIAGQRTGCRSVDEALALAQALAASPAVRLGGVECYEGPAAVCDPALDPVQVSDLVRRVLEVARACDAKGWFAPGDILLSAGGSAVFDLVLPLLQAQCLSQPVCGVLRSGCYLAHDHTHYRNYLRLVEQREGLADSLLPALEVWALVQSVPEPGLALLTCTGPNSVEKGGAFSCSRSGCAGCSHCSAGLERRRVMCRDAEKYVVVATGARRVPPCCCCCARVRLALSSSTRSRAGSCAKALGATLGASFRVRACTHTQLTPPLPGKVARERASWQAVELARGMRTVSEAAARVRKEAKGMPSMVPSRVTLKAREGGGEVMDCGGSWEHTTRGAAIKGSGVVVKTNRLKREG